MDNIKRYEPALVLDEHNDKVPAEMDWASDGEYVRSDEAASALAAKDAEIASLKEEIEGMTYKVSAASGEYSVYTNDPKMACELSGIIATVRREALEEALETVRKMMPPVWDEGKIESFRASGNSGDMAEAESHYTEVYILTKLDTAIRTLIEPEASGLSTKAAKAGKAKP